MQQSKYLIGEAPSGALSFTGAFVFSTAFDHREMAQRIFGPDLKGLQSAGMVAIEATDDGRLNIGTFGESVSLQMRPMSGDHRIIARTLGKQPSDIANW